MGSVRKTISMPDVLYARAEELQYALAHPDLSSLVQQLIREEWERRYGPIQVIGTPASALNEVSSGPSAAVQKAADDIEAHTVEEIRSRRKSKPRHES